MTKLDQKYVEAHATGARKPAEALTIYDDPNRCRYVVSLIVGYSDMELGTSDTTTAKRVVDANMREAAHAALRLTQDEGASGTNWYVYDRKTKRGEFFEQGDFDNAGD